MDYIYEELERQRLALERLLQPAEKRGEDPRNEEAVLRRSAMRRTADTSAFRAGAFAADAVFMPTAAAENGGGVTYPAAASVRGTAEHISRSVERDARRYDGGYQMY